MKPVAALLPLATAPAAQSAASSELDAAFASALTIALVGLAVTFLATVGEGLRARFEPRMGPAARWWTEVASLGARVGAVGVAAAAVAVLETSLPPGAPAGEAFGARVVIYAMAFPVPAGLIAAHIVMRRIEREQAA